VRLILASASPRRADLLSAAGYRFEILPADVDERPLPGERPYDYVLRIARAKARAGAREPDAVVLGADTAVVVDGSILGKPADDADAARMLGLLSGREHRVLTGVALVWGRREVGAVEATAVSFKPLTDEEIADYVASGEPRGKAGAYAVQGQAARFVSGIKGSYSNVVGLPVERVSELLADLGAPGGAASAARLDRKSGGSPTAD
jgi:septum formation protein